MTTRAVGRGSGDFVDASRASSLAARRARCGARWYANASERAVGASAWSELAERGVDVNPCNSPKHPAALAGVAGVVDRERPRRSLQEAYDPHCIDFVCGHAHDGASGIGLKTYRCETEEDVCESRLTFPRQYEEIPGIIAPAMYGVVASAHGNWAASIALMDRAILPRPPLVTLKSLRCDVSAPCGPGEALVLRSRIVSVDDRREPFKVVVAVEVKSDLTQKLVARAECAYEKIGAVRSMRR